MVVFQALDWGLSESEEHKLSDALEQLIASMTGSDLSDEESTHRDQDDEGIENDSDDERSHISLLSLDDVVQVDLGTLFSNFYI